MCGVVSGFGFFVRKQMLHPTNVSLEGFEFPKRVPTCTLSGLVPSVQVALFPLPSVSFALSSPPTLW